VLHCKAKDNRWGSGHGKSYLNSSTSFQKNSGPQLPPTNHAICLWAKENGEIPCDYPSFFHTKFKNPHPVSNTSYQLLWEFICAVLSQLEDLF
jgi:hypothetical protein